MKLLVGKQHCFTLFGYFIQVTKVAKPGVGYRKDETTGDLVEATQSKEAQPNG